MDDVLIVGGGAIGLSLAYELSRHRLRVRIVDRGQPGLESSWAGAGILPPAVLREGDHPLEQLTGLSHALHAEWAERLRAETGVDTGFLRCGGLYLAAPGQSDAELQSLAERCSAGGLRARWLKGDEVLQIEPALNMEHFGGACLLEDECQLRNPRHVKALLAACRQQGVEIECGCSVDGFQTHGNRVEAALCGSRQLRAGQFCIAGGAWSGAILERLGCRAAIRPMRGQIVMLSGTAPLVRRVVNVGESYLVPRPDGRVLVGSTMEDVGFDKRNTACAIGELIQFALRLVPDLKTFQPERIWAGLRPGNADGLPYLGGVPGLENAYVAAGHFRQGLHLSTGTAVVMSQLMRGQKPQIDLSPFRIDRS